MAAICILARSIYPTPCYRSVSSANWRINYVIWNRDLLCSLLKCSCRVSGFVCIKLCKRACDSESVCICTRVMEWQTPIDLNSIPSAQAQMLMYISFEIHPVFNNSVYCFVYFVFATVCIFDCLVEDWLMSNELSR